MVFFSYNAFKSLMDKDMWVRGGVRHKRGTVEGGKTELGYRRGESTVQKGTKKKMKNKGRHLSSISTKAVHTFESF